MKKLDIDNPSSLSKNSIGANENLVKFATNQSRRLLPNLTPGNVDFKELIEVQKRHQLI